MGTLILYNIRSMLRSTTIVIWVLAFPLILATIFMVMFTDMDTNAQAMDIGVGVVADADYEAAPALDQMLTALSEPGTGTDASDADADGALLALTEFDDEAAANRALLDGAVEAYITVDAEGLPTMHVAPAGAGSTRQAIVQALLDRYIQSSGAVGQLAANDPVALADPSAVAALVAALSGDDATTETLDVMRVDPSEMARFYYALLGFSSIVGCSVSTMLVERVRANTSETGIRCQVSAATPTSQLLAAFVAGWLVNFCCMLVAFSYVHFVAGVAFGGREVLAPVVCAACALLSCMLGAVIGSIPGVSAGVRGTIACTCNTVLSLPAGLYGEPCMNLSNWMNQNAAFLQHINPVVQVSEAFYALAYYDSLAPLAAAIARMAGLALVLFAVAALFMRRQSYASL